MIAVPARPEPIEMRTRPDGGVDVLTRPAMSAITENLLRELDPSWYESDNVLVFGPRARYRIGAYQPRTRTYLLLRLA